MLSLRHAWAAPTTAIGLVVASLAVVRGRIAWVDGVLEAQGPLLRAVLTRLPLPGGVSAMTLGHVVVARDAAALERTRSHERVHVRQYECWGPFFVPAYVVASLWALARGGHFYFDNRFERAAEREAVRAGATRSRATDTEGDASG